MKPHGSFPPESSGAKDLIDFWLTRAPRVYSRLERFRHWVNWDKRLYLSLIRTGNVVLDVGANTGAHAVMFSHLAGKTGLVMAFEPVPKNFSRLRETLARRCRFANVKTFQVAVGNPRSPEEKAILRAPGEDLTQASLKLQTEGSWIGATSVNEYPCSIVGLDTLIAQQHLASVDFVKIDVEGGELDVVKGGARMLREYLPLVYCEVDARWTSTFGYSPAQLFEFVGSLGYREARVFGQSHPCVVPLDRSVGSGTVNLSANVLFSSERHMNEVARFDRIFSLKREG